MRPDRALRRAGALAARVVTARPRHADRSAIVLVAVGLALLGRTSLEAAERRSRLVGQLRFAATLQDLRTVVVLRRQLAMELPRLRPWVRVPVRGNRPGARCSPAACGACSGGRRRGVARLVLLGGDRRAWRCAARGRARRRSSLLAGLALFVAGLDTVEALAQEVDHPSRRDGVAPRCRRSSTCGTCRSGVLGQALVAAIGDDGGRGAGRRPGADRRRGGRRPCPWRSARWPARW